MMVAIFTDIIEIVIFTACANTLLRINSVLQLGKVRVRIDSVEEDRLILIYISVGKEKGRVVIRDNRR